MYRVTTPKSTFKMPLDSSDCSIIQVTFRQGKHKLVKEYDGTLPSGMTLDNDKVIIILTQEETKDFDYGDAYVQLRALTDGGEAYASESFHLIVEDVENDTVLGGTP